MIAIIDYGLGNVRAFANVYNRLNIPVLIARRPDELEGAEKIILPGVGAFDQAMEFLEKSGLRDMLNKKVHQARVPVLGVCVGMQMLADSSEEGTRSGLGWIGGEVKKFSALTGTGTFRVPHMGWNNVKPRGRTGLMNGIDTSSLFYFLHSYYFKTKSQDHVIGVTDYYGEFACAVASGNIYGVQFHPEKSHGWGARLLENFAKL